MQVNSLEEMGSEAMSKILEIAFLPFPLAHSTLDFRLPFERTTRLMVILGPTNHQGNRGENVKKVYYYHDSTPTQGIYERIYKQYFYFHFI